MQARKFAEFRGNYPYYSKNRHLYLWVPVLRRIIIPPLYESNPYLGPYHQLVSTTVRVVLPLLYPNWRQNLAGSHNISPTLPFLFWVSKKHTSLTPIHSSARGLGVRDSFLNSSVILGELLDFKFLPIKLPLSCITFPSLSRLKSLFYVRRFLKRFQQYNELLRYALTFKFPLLVCSYWQTFFKNSAVNTNYLKIFSESWVVPQFLELFGAKLAGVVSVSAEELGIVGNATKRLTLLVGGRDHLEFFAWGSTNSRLVAAPHVDLQFLSPIPLGFGRRDMLETRRFNLEFFDNLTCLTLGSKVDYNQASLGRVSPNTPVISWFNSSSTFYTFVEQPNTLFFNVFEQK